MNAVAICPAIRLDLDDNVVISRIDLPEGTLIWSENFTTRHAVPQGHKISTCAIRQGEPVLKGSAVIGYASEDVVAGTWMHSHNLVCITELNPQLTHSSRQEGLRVLPESERATFQGIVRADGRIATRNFIGVLVVGNCGASAARQTADWFDEEELAAYPNVDGVVPLIHEIGCGMEMTGEPMELLRRTISGFIRHPNIAAAVVVALGCERNNLGVFLEKEQLVVGDKLKTVTIQDVGGTRNTVEIAKGFIRDMLPSVNAITRQTVSADHLLVAMQSSTQDGFSGITANPVLGRVADKIIRNGGTVVLSETPEFLWIHKRLQARAATAEVWSRIESRIEWWRWHSLGRDTEATGRLNSAAMDAGISTALEKAVDSFTKTGSAPVQDAYGYAHSISAKGLVFMDTPDADAISVTGQIAGGANVVLMSTGTGTSFGSLPIPTLKLASNQGAFNRFSSDIDIHCGAFLSGEETLERLAELTFARLLKVASGWRTKGEANGVDANEYIPWSVGVVA